MTRHSIQRKLWFNSPTKICIIPALIIFLSCFTVAGIVRYTKGKQDLAFKQWAYISLCYGSYNTKNPLFSDCKEFEKWYVNGSAVSMAPKSPCSGQSTK